MYNHNTTLIIGIVIIIIAAIGGLFWLMDSKKTDDTSDIDLSTIQSRLLNLAHLTDLQLDTAIFQKENFRTLEKYDFPAPPEEFFSRKNPFLSL